jgi:hypothetical protein
MMRQAAGAFMEYEKGRLIAKLRGAGNASARKPGKRSAAGSHTPSCA